METIREYVCSLMLVALVSGTVSVLSPEGGVKKYVKFAASLIAAIMLLIPFRGLLTALPELLSAAVPGTAASTGSDAGELYVGRMSEAAARELEERLSDELGVEGRVKLTFELDGGEAVLVLAEVKTSSAGREEEIAAFVGGLCGGVRTEVTRDP